MPLLFSYGTLQQQDVQQATFGRVLKGSGDELPQYEPSRVPVTDTRLLSRGQTHHANVTFNGRNDSRVRGSVYEVSEAELAAADEFERPFAYARTAVTLASNKQAWVYVHAPSRFA
jgi:gamma-glutamylcyclotransferase (GGCT)/AIG2-like uncharacterized protein YtfP